MKSETGGVCDEMTFAGNVGKWIWMQMPLAKFRDEMTFAGNGGKRIWIRNHDVTA